MFRRWIVLCALCAGGLALAQTGVNPGPTRGADHVGLTVRDLAASTAFFEDVLGFGVSGEDAEYPAKFLSDGYLRLTLWQTTDPASAVAFDRKNNVGLHHLAIAVRSEAELDGLYARIAAAPGVVVEFAPEPFYGGPSRHMMLREPSGNRIELIFRSESKR